MSGSKNKHVGLQLDFVWSSFGAGGAEGPFLKRRFSTSRVVVGKTCAATTRKGQ